MTETTPSVPRPDPQIVQPVAEPESARRQVLLFVLPFLSVNLFIGGFVMAEIPPSFPF